MCQTGGISTPNDSKDGDKFKMLTRRHFIATSTALFSMPVAKPVLASSQPSAAQMAAWDTQVTPPDFNLETSNPWGLHQRFLPQRVEANDGLTPGDIHVDAVARYLYHIEEGGTAMRFGVAIARGNLYEPGTYTIRRKVRWPHWTPTKSMIERTPKYAEFENGQEPGPQNALGSRALYLYVGQRDTYLRIHGTPLPRSIGGRASSGCVRMVMAHINDLYPRVRKGSTAFLYSAEDSVTASG